MSTPQDPQADPSARTETEPEIEIEIDPIEEIEPQLRDGISPVSAQEQVVEAFLK